MHKKTVSGILLTLLLTSVVVLAFNVQCAIASAEFIDSGQNLGDSYTRSVILGDIDEDGDLDFVAGNSHGQPNKVYLNDGNGRFSDSGQNLGSSGTYGVSLGDVDNDEDLDLIIANYAHPNQVYLNNGQGVFVDSGQLLGGSSYFTFSVALGDIDEDGDLDFVAGNMGGGGAGHENKVYVNNGAGIFVDSGQSLGSSSTKSIALADIDSDSDLDLVVGNDNYQANKVYLNDGTGTFADSGQNLGVSMTESIALGDLDSDGDLDLVAGNYHPDANTVWLNDGAGIFTDSGQNFGSPSIILSLALGDVDNDGDLDLVQGSRHPSGGGYPNKVYLNDGTGTFADSGQNLGVSMTESIALGDLDSDGDLDLVAGNAEYGLNANKIYINQCVSPFPVIYIRPDGSIDPPTAPIQRDGDLYTLTDDILSDTDGIVIERSNMTLDGAGHALQGTGASDSKGITLNARQNVTIKNLDIRTFCFGIDLVDSINVEIHENTITAISITAIDLTRSSGNTISQNNFTNNEYCMYIYQYSNDNRICENNLSNNYVGIYPSYSSDRNNISRNNLVNNDFGIWLGGSCNNIVAGNKIKASKERGIKLEDFSDYNSITGNNIEASNGTAIYLSESSNHNSISDNNMSGNEYGIWLWHSSNYNGISGNCIGANKYGLWLSYSLNNSISGNIVEGNDFGVQLLESSNNSISENNVEANHMYGIYLNEGSNNNDISGNNIRANEHGVWLYGSSNNKMWGNNITANSEYGVQLLASPTNYISGNNMENNGYGIWLFESSNNCIHHNSFINNTNQVYDLSWEVPESPYSINVWDDGYPSGGNYWSNYSGVDEKSGPCQDQLGSDGIGDTPYVIDENNQDDYPLMLERELVASITAPASLQLGNSSSLNATVTNRGLNDEVDVELVLLINGTTIDSTTISLLKAGNSYTLSYIWTPTATGTFNVTAHVPPLPEEVEKENNQATKFVTVVTQPPVASFTYSSTSPTVGETVTFDASASYDPDGSIVNYEWDFGDATTDLGETVTHVYTNAGTYLVTLTVTDNKDATDTETSTITILPKVGVEAGDWIKCNYAISGWPAGTPYPLWLKVEFLSFEETSATVRVTMRMSDGTEQNATVPVDIAAGGGKAFGLSGFVIPADLKTGDTVFMSGYGNVTIEGETTRTYAGASRRVVYASLSQYGTELTYYWDKETGIMVEASTTSGGITAAAKATETNMWQPTPFWMQWWFYAIVAIGIVALVGVVYFLTKRKPSTSTAPTPPTEGTMHA